MIDSAAEISTLLTKKQLLKLIRALAAAVLVLDLEDRVERADQAVEELLGIPRQSMEGRTLSEISQLTEGLDGLRISDAVGESRSTDGPVEYGFKRPDGSIAFAAISAVPVESAGRVTGTVLAMRDVTEAKLDGAALRDSEERYRGLFEAAFDGIVTHDRGTIVDINPAFESMFGYKRDELIGRSGLLLVAKEYRDAVKEKIDTGYELPYEAVCQRKDGSTFVAEILGKSHIFNGRPLRVTGVRDMTERTRVEDQLLLEKRRLDDVTVHANSGLFLLDDETRIVYANQVAEEWFGPLDTLKGKYCWQVFQLRDPEKECAGLKALHTGDSVDSDAFVRSIQGEDKYLYVAATPVKDKSGRVRQVTEVVIDITDRKRAEQRLAAQYAVARILAESADLADAVPHLLRAIGENLGWKLGGFYNVVRSENRLRRTETWHIPSIKESDDIAVYLRSSASGIGLADQVWQSGRPECITDVAAETGFPYAEIALKAGLRGVCALPVTLEDRVVAVMTFFGREMSKQDEDLLEMLSTIGRQIGEFVERKAVDKALIEKEEHSQSLLRLSKKLEQAQAYPEVLQAALDEVRTVIGYQNFWVYLFDEDKRHARALVASGEVSEPAIKEFPTLTIEGDRMMEEIAAAKGIIVVEDAVTDERTDKEIVAKLGNRTIVNVPIILFDRHLGSAGTGTFGDEGMRVPSLSEQAYLAAMASHLAVTLDRIRLLGERKQAEYALSIEKRKLDDVAVHANVGLLLLDDQARVMYANRLVEEWFGSAERILGRPCWEVFRLQDPDTQCAGLRAIRTRDTAIGDAFSMVSDGHERFFHKVATPILNEAGNIDRITEVVIDITERVRAETATREKDAAVRQAYVDVFSAVTGERLIIMTSEEIESVLGTPASAPYVLGSYEDLAGARALLRDTLAHLFPKLTDVSGLVTAAGEAMANTIKHAGGGRVHVFKAGATAQVLVSDAGPGIDFGVLPKATLLAGFSTKFSLGLGFTLMLDLCDKVMLSTEPGRTSIVLEANEAALVKPPHELPPGLGAKGVA